MMSQEGPSRDGSGEADGTGVLEEQKGPALVQHRVPWRGGIMTDLECQTKTFGP